MLTDVVLYNEGVGLAPMHPIDGNSPPGEAPAVPTVWNGEGARLAPVHPINGDPLLGVAPAVPTDVVRWGCGARAYAPGQAPTVARLSAMPTEDRDKNGRWVASHVCAHAWRAAMPDATQLGTRGHLVCSRCSERLYAERTSAPWRLVQLPRSDPWGVRSDTPVPDLGGEAGACVSEWEDPSTPTGGHRMQSGVCVTHDRREG